MRRIWILMLGCRELSIVSTIWFSFNFHAILDLFMSTIRKKKNFVLVWKKECSFCVFLVVVNKREKNIVVLCVLSRLLTIGVLEIFSSWEGGLGLNSIYEVVSIFNQEDFHVGRTNTQLGETGLTWVLSQIMFKEKSLL